MAKVTLSILSEMKKNGEKFASLTAYDATLAHLVSSQGVEVILVGDSLSNVCQDHTSTVPVRAVESDVRSCRDSNASLYQVQVYD